MLNILINLLCFCGIIIVGMLAISLILVLIGILIGMIKGIVISFTKNKNN